VKKIDKEFDIERMKTYMAQPAEAKLRYLEEAYVFFESVKDKKTKEISRKLKEKGF